MGWLRSTCRKTGVVLYEWGVETYFMRDPETDDVTEIQMPDRDRRYYNTQLYESFEDALIDKRKDDTKT